MVMMSPDHLVLILIGVPALIAGFYAHYNLVSHWLGDRRHAAEEYEKRLFPD
jgi:hypothetical protein